MLLRSSKKTEAKKHAQASLLHDKLPHSALYLAGSWLTLCARGFSWLKQSAGRCSPTSDPEIPSPKQPVWLRGGWLYYHYGILKNTDRDDGYRKSFKRCHARRNRVLYCARLLTVRFSLKLRLKEEACFKPSICNTKVGKSKTKPTIKTTFGKHPL